MFEGPASWSCIRSVHQFPAVQKSHLFLVYSNSKYTVTLGDTPCLYDKHILIFKMFTGWWSLTILPSLFGAAKNNLCSCLEPQTDTLPPGHIVRANPRHWKCMAVLTTWLFHHTLCGWTAKVLHQFATQKPQAALLARLCTYGHLHV